MTFTLFVPCQLWTCNAERRMHHHKRANLVRPARQAAELLTRNKQADPMVQPVTVDFYPYQANRGVLADTAGHMPPCKAVLDGCVDAGLLEDDTPEFVVSQTFHPPQKSKVTGVRIVIRPVI